MKTVVTWMRECDEQHFGFFFSPRRDIRLLNARVESARVTGASGLLLTGGPDISPEFLRQPVPDPALVENPDQARDAWEFASLEAALDDGMPVFAICKGMQLLNVALGGTLHLDITGHNDPALKTANCQPLRHATGTRHRYEAVNSSHHQAVDILGVRLEIEAWCASDDVIEQVRWREHPWALGVQYHPERDPVYSALFDDFFAHLE